MSSSFWLLGFESPDFSQSEKEKKLLVQLCKYFFFLSMRKITWLNSQQQKTRGYVEHLIRFSSYRNVTYPLAQSQIRIMQESNSIEPQNSSKQALL